ncbi:MAG: NUDIX domain-containing protein, partial [Candidatus Nanohaloarchaea archaeon]
MEADESPTEAAKREAEEEIGVKVELEKPFFSGEFQHRDQVFLWHGYVAGIVEGEPEPGEEKFSEMRWFSGDELEEVELAPNLE